jgi:CBS domain-containing protein
MARMVKEVMTKKVVTAGVSDPFKDIVRLMHEYRVSALPVIDGAGRLAGIVSEADLLLKEERAGEVDQRRLLEGRRRRVVREKAGGLVASELMTSPVVTVSPEATLSDAARLMHQRGVKRLPVVDRAGLVVGIVSRADLLRVFLRPDHEIRDEIQQDVIFKTLWMDPAMISVGVREGVVTLEGQVERRSLVGLLVHLVCEVAGVVGVDNGLSFDIDDSTSRFEYVAPWVLPAPAHQRDL